MKHPLPFRAALCVGLAIGMAEHAQAQAFTEHFDDFSTLGARGWAQQNNSAPLGSTAWFQGAVDAFSAQNGSAHTYIAANFNSTGVRGTISTWLFTPTRTLTNGDVLTFYTRRRPVQPEAPDRLEVRMSMEGGSADVGTTALSVGDFSTLLLSINPTLVVGVYPGEWTQYTATVGGLSAPVSGRLAFRYFITSGGALGNNGEYIGIDNVVYTPYDCPTLSITNASLAGTTVGTAYTATLAQTGSLGAPNYAVTAGALPPGLTLAANGTISGTPTATGTFNFTASVNDNSGCSGSKQLAITVVCRQDVASLSAVPAFCSNADAYDLVEGLPAGGTYSGVGVVGGSFDPQAGSSTVTYHYTDPYGCAHSATTAIVVNDAPAVTAQPFAVCASATELELTGAAPAGGTWSGTGVAAGHFDPAVGSQDLSYTYTDANNCSATAEVPVVVNALPVLALPEIEALCANDEVLALTGATPAGGTWSGRGVADGSFDPAVGGQDLSYSYTDANGCSATATVSVVVNAASVVEVSEFEALCANDEVLVLSGATPAGGTWSGTGVADGIFDPEVGTQLLTYSYTDANQCTASAATTISVNALPVVSLETLPMVCRNHSALVLTGAEPVGGVWSGPGVADNSFHPAVADVGIHTLTYSFTDANGCSGSEATTITVDLCAGVQEVSAHTVRLYPNPASDHCFLEADGPILAVRVLDATGSEVQVRVSEGQVGRARVELEGLPAGIYLVQTQVGQQILVQRMLKH